MGFMDAKPTGPSTMQLMLGSLGWLAFVIGVVGGGANYLYGTGISTKSAIAYCAAAFAIKHFVVIMIQ